MNTFALFAASVFTGLSLFVIMLIYFAERVGPAKTEKS